MSESPISPCITVDGVYCYGCDKYDIPCSNIGCKNVCVISLEYDKSQGYNCVEYSGSCFGTGTEFSILSCECFAPVCIECIENTDWGNCKICGQKDVHIETIPKNDIMENHDFRYYPNLSDSKEKWMMMHQDCYYFIQENFPNGDYPNFRDWFLNKTGKRIDIEEMNTRQTCRMVHQYKLHMAKRFFASSSLYIFQYSHELWFKQLSEKSDSLCQFYAINSFLPKKHGKVYPFFGLTAKVVKKLMQKTQKQRDLSHFFMRLCARYFQKRLQF